MPTENAVTIPVRIDDIRPGQKTRAGVRINRLHPTALASNPGVRTVFEPRWRCQAGRFHSIHASPQAAEKSASSCRGKHPYGRNVRIVPTIEEFFDL